MYRFKKYRPRKLEDIFKDIDTMARYQDVYRVFLADGDAMVLDTPILVKILEYLYKSFKYLERVTTYASPYNLHDKTLDELITL